MVRKCIWTPAISHVISRILYSHYPRPSLNIELFTSQRTRTNFHDTKTRMRPLYLKSGKLIILRVTTLEMYVADAQTMGIMERGCHPSDSYCTIPCVCHRRQLETTAKMIHQFENHATSMKSDLSSTSVGRASTPESELSSRVLLLGSDADAEIFG
jgi:hypothetical protein